MAGTFFISRARLQVTLSTTARQSHGHFSKKVTPMQLHEIREAKTAAVTDMRRLIDTAQGEKRSLNPAEQTAFEAFKSKVVGLEADEGRAVFMNELERRSAGQAITGSGDKSFDAECRAFSLSKAIAAQMPNSNVEAGREREIGQELARRSGRKFEGIAVPVSVFEERILTTAIPGAGPGSNIIATDYRGDLFIDRLRNAIKVRQLGATVLSGLVGNVDIPRLKASTTTGWVAENTPLTPADPQFDKVSMTPRHCGALVEYSRNMIQQASPDVEQLMRRDMAMMLAEAIDTAAINGSGTGANPRGILNVANIGNVAIGANGGPINWAAVIDLIGAVETVNATGNGFLTNTRVTRTARKTLKTATDTASNMVMTSPNELAGYQLQATNLVPNTLTKGTSASVCSPLIFGNWADLLLGYWSELDVLVNPFESSAYAKGNVQVRAMLTMDVQVRQAASFAAILDLTTP